MSATNPASATRLAVVGTAGHIDHGKTAMVRRLTGIDTDRLPEEKKRGISIDLGFAPLVTPAGVRIGLVDVPGHERFVKNMLAGVGGIDLVLLVIAADEGVMPQTREHFAIIKLLGIERGIVVITKSDLVDDEWASMVNRDARGLVANSALADAPILEFSAVTGTGAPELMDEIDRQLESVANRPLQDHARLPVDRVFTMEGFGTVVTGTLWRGHVRVGDHLELLPQAKRVRVRRVQVHGKTVEEAFAGQRTALALHGVDRHQVSRGDWAVTPGSLRPSSILDVRFELLDDYPREWGMNTRVRYHLGASEVIGRLVLLEGDKLEAGQSALAQLRLERPTVASRGDRFVIRAYSPMRTVGGGRVIEPIASKRRKHAPGLEQLAVHESGSIEARLLERLGTETKLSSTAVLAQALSEPEAAVGDALRRLAGSGEVTEAAGRWVSGALWAGAREHVEAKVRDFAAAHPGRYGMPKGELKSGFKGEVDAKLFDAVFGSLVQEATLEQRGDLVRPGDQPWSPPADLMRALEQLESDLEASGLAVPETPKWQAKLGKSAGEVASLGIFLGRLTRVSHDFTYTTRQLEGLRDQLAGYFAKHPGLRIGDFRELTGLSRKYGVPLLEHCDRLGWTIRAGDERKAGGRL